jgi:5-methylcytosine-specific restriction endonuclease McrA
MPSSREYRERYPKDWEKVIRPAILERAGHRCEGSPLYPDCRIENYAPIPGKKSKVVLTVAHLDHTPENCDPANLRAWCQNCHLTYDKEMHAAKRAATLAAKRAAKAARAAAAQPAAQVVR